MLHGDEQVVETVTKLAALPPEVLLRTEYRSRCLFHSSHSSPLFQCLLFVGHEYSDRLLWIAAWMEPANEVPTRVRVATYSG